MYDQYLFVFYCKKCGKQNAYDTGDPEDMTAFEPDAYSCYNCGEVKVVFDEYVKLGLQEELNIDKAKPIQYYVK